MKHLAIHQAPCVTGWRALEEKEANDFAVRRERVWVVTGPVFSGVVKQLHGGERERGNQLHEVGWNRTHLRSSAALVMPRSIPANTSWCNGQTPYQYASPHNPNGSNVAV